MIDDGGAAQGVTCKQRRRTEDVRIVAVFTTDDRLWEGQRVDVDVDENDEKGRCALELLSTSLLFGDTSHGYSRTKALQIAALSGIRK